LFHTITRMIKGSRRYLRVMIQWRCYSHPSPSRAGGLLLNITTTNLLKGMNHSN